MTEQVSADEFSVVHASNLRFFPDLVEELGGDPARFAALSGIEADDLRRGTARMTYRQLVDLFEAAAHELRCPDFGMRLAERQGGASVFGPLGTVMKNSPTFGDALNYVVNHTYAHSLAARISFEPIPDTPAVLVSHDILLDKVSHRAQAIEHILLLGHLAAIEITGGQARVRQVLLRHQPQSDLKSYRRYFGCRVRFGQERDGVVFSAWDLGRPVIDRDAEIYNAAMAHIERSFRQRTPPLHARVRGLVAQSLGQDGCRNEQVARELGMNLRTMHRKLAAEGTSFQRIKDEIRRDLMLYYLQHTKLDFAYVSERLGFAEQSVFTRSCNRWFSASPTRIRASRGP